MSDDDYSGLFHGNHTNSVEPDDIPTAGDFVDGGEILIGKLVSTLLGAVWLAVAGGWISLLTAFAELNIGIVRLIAGIYARIIRAFGVGGATNLRAVWGDAARAALEASPMAAPMLLTLELITVSALLLLARRRWV